MVLQFLAFLFPGNGVLPMYALGIDIGTTNIAGVLLDLENGDVAAEKVIANDFGVDTGLDFAAVSDAEAIAAAARRIFGELSEAVGTCNIASVGFTGQMHGIVYVGKDGSALAPFVTWQDLRGALKYKDGLTYSEYVSSVTGMKVAPGYGAVTYFYDKVNGLVPEGAEKLLTIYDFAAIELTGGFKPCIHPSSAASIGLFDIKHNCFDRDAILKLGLYPSLFPDVAEDHRVIGLLSGRIPVTVGIGDNQAGFIGSVRDHDSSVLVNIGTGSQVSLVTERLDAPEGIEIRPFISGKYLAAGSALCGGKSIAVLADFLKDIANAFGVRGADVYSVIDNAPGLGNTTSPLKVDTRFMGTRSDPAITGSITGITTSNLTLGNLAAGFMDGISGELFDMYKLMAELYGPKAVVAGAGGALRKSNALRARVERDFGGKVLIPRFGEEAAFGAALYGAVGAGYFKDIAEAAQFVNY